MNTIDASACWIVIPARGGSRGIPRKNVRPLGNKPLIHHLLERFSPTFSKNNIIVTTDDDEIARLSEQFATIHRRSPHLASDTATLDDVAVEVAKWLIQTQNAHSNDIMLMMQPTSPFLSHKAVEEGIQKLHAGGRSVITVKDDRHLRWTVDDNGLPKPLYLARVNRQWQPPTYGETGGLFGARLEDIITTGTRINEPISLIIVDSLEGLDIDSYADWAVAEFYLRRKRIVIRADASPNLGMGHVYRALALAHEMGEHDLTIVTRRDNGNQLGSDFLQKYPYRVQTIISEEEFFAFLDQAAPQLLLLDILDTSASYMEQIKNRDCFVVNLEDLGEGSRFADIVVNDLYSDLYPLQNHWYGVENSILAPHFETISSPSTHRDTVETILISFGGTDTSNLTVKALESLQSIKYAGKVIVVLGPGYKHGSVDLIQFGLNGDVLQSVNNMAFVAQNADLAVTSAGRTVTELMTLGVPTLVLCQNMHEIRHTHASSVYGVINLGLGQYVEISTIAKHLQMLLDNPSTRADMRTRALNAVRDRSNRKIVRRILQTAFGADLLNMGV